MFVIACYDVPSKRTEKYRKLLAQYLLHLQESVFGGDITETQFKALRRRIRGVYNDNDHVMWITTENKHNIRVERWQDGCVADDTQHRGSGII